MNIIRQYFAQWVGNKILYDIRDRLFDHFQKLSLKYYASTKTGEIISRVINDVEQTKKFVMTGLMNVWLDMMTILIAISIMFTMDIEIDDCCHYFVPVIWLSVKYFYGGLRRLTRERSQELAEVQGHFHERVQGIPVTRSLRFEDYEQEQFAKRNKHFLQRAMEHVDWNAMHVCRDKYNHRFSSIVRHRLWRRTK